MSFDSLTRATAYFTREEAMRVRAKSVGQARRISDTKILADCSDGRHLPDPQTVADDNEIRRAQCRRCRCSIMRMAWSKQWMFSGILG